jgi:phosphatidylinositol-3-phosphatase
VIADAGERRLRGSVSRFAMLACTLLALGARPGGSVAPPVGSIRPAGFEVARSRVALVHLTDHGCTAPATVPAGRVQFRIVNTGRIAHVFMIAGRRATISAGRSGLLTLDLSPPGRFAYRCFRRGGSSFQSGQIRAVPRLTGVPSAARPCGVTTTPPAVYTHVVWIVLENKSYSQVIHSKNAPNINRYAEECGLASNFYAEAHPSLPNYIAMTSGQTQGITDDSGPASHPLQAGNIFQQVGDWRALEESMPSNCSLSYTDSYAVRHNPAAYYTGLRSACASRDVPLGPVPDLSARFTFITPNLCHDMHASQCASNTTDEVRQGDMWLSSFLASILDSPQYRSGTTVVFVTWDEDDGGTTQHIPTLVLAPSVRPGTVAAARFDHYSLLRTTEELIGLNGFLGAAAGAPSMRSAFHI